MIIVRRIRIRVPAAVSVLVVLSVLALTGYRTLGFSQQPAPESLLLVGARILDVRAGRYLGPAAVLVSGDRIQSLGASIPANLPPTTRRIDLAGATLVPGLGDMFAAAWPDGTTDADFYYAMALAHGVTEFRVVGGRLPWAASQRDRAARGEILAPRLAIAGPQLEQRPSASSSKRLVSDAQAARREVAQQTSSGVDWISVGPSTSQDLYKTILPAARAARLKVSGEPGVVSVADLLRLGVDAVDRLGFFDRPTNYSDTTGDDQWQSASAATLSIRQAKGARRAATLIPLLASFSGTLGAAETERDRALQLLPQKWRDALVARAHPANWPRAATAAAAAEARGRLVKTLMASGVRVATGVDVNSGGYSVPGAGVHRELSLLVKAGLSPLDAIRAATVNCAEMLGTAGSLGQVRAGYKADLIAVDGDPLANIEDLRRIKLVVRGGEALDPSELLAQARRAAR